MEFVVTVCMLGLITGLIAKRKGHPFLGWFFGGALFAIVFLPWAIFMKTTDDELLRRIKARGIHVNDYEQTLEPTRIQIGDDKRGRLFSFGKIAIGCVAVVVALTFADRMLPSVNMNSGSLSKATAANSPAIITPPPTYNADVLKAMFKENNLRAENALKGKWVDINGTFGNVKSQFGKLQVSLVKDYEWNTSFLGYLADSEKQSAEELSSGDQITLRCLIGETFADIPNGNGCIILR